MKTLSQKYLIAQSQESTKVKRFQQNSQGCYFQLKYYKYEKDIDATG